MRETPRRENVVPVSGAVLTSPLSKKVTLRGSLLSVKVVASGVPSGSARIAGPKSLMTFSSLGDKKDCTMLPKPAASGSGSSHCTDVPETPGRAIVQLSAKLRVTVRGFPFKVAVSDVEESSVIMRLSMTPARIGSVPSVAVITTISAGNIFRLELDIISPSLFRDVSDNA